MRDQRAIHEDRVLTARVGFKNLKVEGHFIDGYASEVYPAGFYPQQNPQGFKPNTNALILKTGFHF